jgi:hypothetical protein
MEALPVSARLIIDRQLYIKINLLLVLDGVTLNSPDRRDYEIFCP